jgi:hypothetical protein
LDLLDHAARIYVDYLFRRRSPGVALVTAGVALIIAILTGLAFNLSFPIGGGLFKLSFSTDAGLGRVVMMGLLGLAILLVLIGLLRLRREFAATDRLRVIAIEIRGLRDWIGAPLVEAVPMTLRGRREPIVLDLRQKVEDGHIVSPERALTEMEALRPRLNTLEAGLDRRDVTHVIGGLAPVPCTFLLGVLADDEGPIRILDWDRHARTWRELSDADDGRRFTIRGADLVGSGTEAVILAVSASYKVDVAGAVAKVGERPLVELELEDASTESNWSDAKQRELARQFHHVVVKLANAGVRQIHLFLAGPSSLVLRLGMTYDKRLLPRLTVYQYERGEQPPFSWGIAMPIAGAPAQVVR